MVNTELDTDTGAILSDYNILNIVVNTERIGLTAAGGSNYNILNIVVNTERFETANS